EAPKPPPKLVILVEAKAEQTPEEVLKTLVKGAELANCRYEGKPEIQGTPAAFFRLLRRLENQPDPEDATTEKQQVTMRPSLDEPTNWLVRVHEPKEARLMKLQVTFAKSGMRPYQPKNPDKSPDAPLQQTLPQSYVLRL